MALNYYELLLTTDNGPLRIRTTASSKEFAIKKAMASEGCPRRAILACRGDYHGRKPMQRGTNGRLDG